MPTKKQERTLREQEELALDQGKVYRVVYDGHRYYRTTLAEAEACRDERIGQLGRKLTPQDISGAKSILTKSIAIEHYGGIVWKLVDGSERTVQQGTGDPQEPDAD